MPLPTNYYVDPAINANSGTGTLLNPFGDLQFALNSITRSTTNGDQINIKAGTAESMSAAITLATYGTSPTRLIFRGYTSAANDGGIGEINFNNSNVNVFAANYDNITCVDMKIGNLGTGGFNFAGNRNHVLCCELHTASGQSTIGGTGSGIAYSLVHVLTGSTGRIVFGSGGCYCTGNLIKSASNTYVLWANGSGIDVIGNVIRQSGNGTAIYLLQSVGDNAQVFNNSIINTASATANGIEIQATAPTATTITNNIIQGWSGTGGCGIRFNGSHTRSIFMIRSNRFFNCATNISGSDASVITDNTTLAATPFTDAANDDYRVNTDVAGIGWPTALKGASLSVNSVDIGALQRVASSGAGVYNPFIQQRIR